MRTFVTSVATLLLAFSSAAAAADQDPVRFWWVSRVDQGAGEVRVAGGAQVGGKLQQYAQVGHVAFNLPLHAPYWYFLPRDHAFGAVSSSADGKHYSVLAQAPPPNPLRVGKPKGAISHLDEYQAYVKRDGDASLRLTISDLLLQTVDDTNPVVKACDLTDSCASVRTVIRFHARAYAASTSGDFFDEGGTAYLEGHQHHWRPGAATSADSAAPLWDASWFEVDGDADDSKTGAAGAMFINKARTLTVPLGAVRTGELFAVHVSLEAEAVDDVGGESAAQAFVQDPQKLGKPLLLTTSGLTPRGKPRFKEPAATALQPARCPAGPSHNAGVVQLSDARFAANESESSPFVLVTRTGGSRGSVSVRVTTRSGSAVAGRDFRSTSTTVRFGNGDTSPRLVEIPLREDREVEPDETFTVELAHAACGRLGARHHASVTIVDDDQGAPPPPPPPPVFHIGGTVDGLRGSGLVLTDRGVDLAVAADGPFTLPETQPAGASYEVQVRTQPHAPDQVCTIEHGAGTIASADVRDVAVHCTTPPVPSGLDPTFGSGGRVSTPVGGDGHGEAVVIQPGGAIVTAGWRSTPSGADFALTRHDVAGNLDHGFGADGIVTTDLGGRDDEASDAALLPDGGIVAVGRTDAGGSTHTDFGVVRYRSDGTLDPGFGSGGIVQTDILGGGDQANAVAVQPDGKIVVAGIALHAGIDGDMALVRYDADGTPDSSFGTGGIVTTDLGTRSDDARAIVIQPDGAIVVAGNTDEDVALARYTPSGQLDPTFGHGGTTTSTLGDEATGVGLTPDGHVVVSGYTVGAGGTRDFLLARFRSDGALDTTFGDQGAVRTDVLGGDDYAEGLVVDPLGRILLVGRATSPTILDMALVRYTADGALDPAFGAGGIVTADFHGRGEFGEDLALDAAGRIVAAGYTADGGVLDFALLRANP
jgi:uncharacterized delta-60 repeat protein